MDRGPAPDDRLRIDLASAATSPAQARRVVRRALWAWELPDLVDVVQLVVSELVTNAVRHGDPPVHLELQRTSDELRLQVHDGSAWSPTGVGSGGSPQAESGRGLQIVAALAQEMTVERVPDDGTVVSARFPTAVA